MWFGNARPRRPRHVDLGQQVVDPAEDPHPGPELVSAGLPFATTVAARDGQTFITHEGRAVEVERYVAGSA